jgi:two-component system, cell cycle sensor histidine kinase and response regulator CckA
MGGGGLEAGDDERAKLVAEISRLRAELDERKANGVEAERFVALVEHSQDFIAMATLDGEVAFVNRAGRALIGLDAGASLEGLTLRDFHTDEGLRRAEILLERGHWIGEGKLRHFVTGELIDVEVSSFLVRDKDGKPCRFATVQRDIRERRKLEAQLRQLQKMEAVSRLAGGIAHDFNNLLTIILSYSSTLASEAALDASLRADVGEIHEAALRASSLTQRLLAFSRQQVFTRRDVDLRAIIEDLRPMIRRLLREDVALRIVTCPLPLVVHVDTAQIEQVVVNLVVNAGDAMPHGGTLTVSVAGADMAGPAAVLTLTDTGHGMDPDTMAHIFDPFFTTKGSKGTGLGLATSSGIVLQCGGTIQVQSEPGRGSMFTVRLPLVEARVPAPEPSVEASIDHAGGTETILLVEDDRQVRTLLVAVLRRAGYTVLEAPDSQAALQQLEGFAGRVDLLVTDVVMPGMNGRQLAERITLSRPGTKVLFLSGYGEDIIAHHGVLDPGIDLLQKPVTPDALLRRVRSTLGR